MPQKILRAGAAPAALAVAGAIAAVPAAHPAPARAASAGARPVAGDVAIARRRLNVVAGRRAMVAGRLNVYRRARVSWYGPGLYGGHLGCGGTLTPGTLGVASRTLPCGTKVTLRHGGRTVRVPVVDRGPYAGGREFDLTAATKDRLGFSGAGEILVADQVARGVGRAA
jgi:rare lipoprotein A (peptidoglycan hydrolase)